MKKIIILLLIVLTSCATSKKCCGQISYKSYDYNIQDILKNQLNLIDHKLKTGDKVFYEGSATGLSTGSYYAYKVNGEKPELKNEITLVAAKVRYGETGSIEMAYDGDKCKMYNSEDELFVPPMTEAQQDEIPF